MSPIDVVLVGGLVLAAVTDVATGKIPNWLTVTMMALGIVVHATLGGDRWIGLLGCAAAFAVHYPLWILRVEKGGDAKLLMGLGACVGWHEMIEASIWYALVYLPVGLGVLVVLGKLPQLLATGRHLLAKARGQATEQPEPTMLRTGPIILVAGLLAHSTAVFEGLI